MQTWTYPRDLSLADINDNPADLLDMFWNKGKGIHVMDEMCHFFCTYVSMNIRYLCIHIICLHLHRVSFFRYFIFVVYYCACHSNFECRRTASISCHKIYSIIIAMFV